jgi:hypothetical protein
MKLTNFFKLTKARGQPIKELLLSTSSTAFTPAHLRN